MFLHVWTHAAQLRRPSTVCSPFDGRLSGFRFAESWPPAVAGSQIGGGGQYRRQQQKALSTEGV